MKPSEMSNEELADLVITAGALFYGDGDDLPDAFTEAAARLRNSIPKPVVRDTPPSVDEVSDDDWCFVQYKPHKDDPHEFWESVHGDTARRDWDKYFCAWMARPLTTQ